MKVIGLVGDHLAIGVEQLHGQSQPEIRGTLERHVDVGLEPFRPWSIVVITVDGVTRSPWRTGISPTMPAVGAVTR